MMGTVTGTALGATAGTATYTDTIAQPTITLDSETVAPTSPGPCDQVTLAADAEESGCWGGLNYAWTVTQTSTAPSTAASAGPWSGTGSQFQQQYPVGSYTAYLVVSDYDGGSVTEPDLTFTVAPQTITPGDVSVYPTPSSDVSAPSPNICDWVSMSVSPTEPCGDQFTYSWLVKEVLDSNGTTITLPVPHRNGTRSGSRSRAPYGWT